MATNPVAHKLPQPASNLDLTQSPLLFLIIAAIVTMSIAAFVFFYSM